PFHCFRFSKAKPFFPLRLRQVIPSTYRRNDNKLGKASALDLMKALPLNSDKGCTSVLCSEGVEICHPHKTDNTVQLLRLLCISYGNLSMKKALKTSLKCFLRNPTPAFRFSALMQDFPLLHRLRSLCPAYEFLLS